MITWLHLEYDYILNHAIVTLMHIYLFENFCIAHYHPSLL